MFKRPQSHWFAPLFSAVLLGAVLLVQFLPPVVEWPVVGSVSFPWGGIRMRLLGERQPFADLWARENMHRYFRGEAVREIQLRRPDVSPEERLRAAEQQLRGFLREQGDVLEGQVASYARDIRNAYRYEENGQSYPCVPEFDSYYHIRYARQVLARGSLGERRPDGGEWDPLMLAPVGRRVEWSLHPWLLAGFHTAVSRFSAAPLMHTAAFFPAVLVFFSLIAGFLAGRRLAGNAAGAFAALVLAVAPVAVQRTLWGNADTDGHNLLFPCLLIWTVVAASAAGTRRGRIAAAAGFGVAAGLYALTWTGWWYFFDLIVLALVVDILVGAARDHVRGKPAAQRLRERGTVAAFLLLFAALSVVLGGGPSALLQTVTEPVRYYLRMSHAEIDLWPNVFGTVAELVPATWEGLPGMLIGRTGTGGLPALAVALAGIVLLCFRGDGRRGDPFAGVLCLVLIAGGLFTALRGARFALLLVPPFCLAFGAGAGLLLEKTWRFLNGRPAPLRFGSVIAAACLLLYVLAPAGRAGAAIAGQDAPQVHRAWWRALEKIRTTSPPDAIISTWWDYGHPCKEIAGRAVTFDGMTQDTPLAYWMGRVLLTADEAEAVGILRMLACASDRAFTKLRGWMDTVSAVRLIREIAVLDREAARRRLEGRGLPAAEVLDCTHCTPPPVYLIVSADMVSKAFAWGHFGQWDFRRAYAWAFLRGRSDGDAINDLVMRAGCPTEEARDMVAGMRRLRNRKEAEAWIAPWPAYRIIHAPCRGEGSLVRCADGFEVDLASGAVAATTETDRTVPAYGAFFDGRGRLVERNAAGSSGETGHLLVPGGNRGFTSIAASPELARSLFTRLFFLEGHGLRHFRLFTWEQSGYGGDVLVYKLDWAGGAPNVFSGAPAGDPAARKGG